MPSWSIFRELKLPVARKKGRLPVFLDFTLSCSSQAGLLPQFIDEMVSRSAHIIDGIIVSSEIELSHVSLRGKEIWIRADGTSSFLPQKYRNQKYYVISQNPQELAQAGISGILGTLMLGNTASLEADNIQHLSLLRSRSFDVGLPFAIDIHISEDCSEINNRSEIFELGLNLAVELGGDFAILPAFDNLSEKPDLDKIAAFPLLVRQPIGDVLSISQSSENQIFFGGKTGGIVLTDLRDLPLVFGDYQQIELWSDSIHLAPMEGR